MPSGTGRQCTRIVLIREFSGCSLEKARIENGKLILTGENERW